MNLFLNVALSGKINFRYYSQLAYVVQYVNLSPGNPVV
jgi:hypothetical protein